mmetsp:Transcript_6018/g.7353  ORF Transcript_6018/g.7353 Transcript_6018/m.7353 type:complete len:187 (+) Transcript_6018:47-607(+)|eukprot:jgi/Bigna1/90285/estExt_fgenesh1_pg.C_660106
MFSANVSSTPLLGGGASVREENEALRTQINELSFRIMKLRKENKALREENNWLKEESRAKESVVVSREQEEGKDGKSSPKQAATSKKPEPSIASFGYQSSAGSMKKEWKHDEEAMVEDHDPLETCYTCGCKDVSAICAGRDCERRLCKAHCHKMLTNSELFCEDCYEYWSNAIPTELAIIAKRLFG